jgi:hypothetical protein
MLERGKTIIEATLAEISSELSLKITDIGWTEGPEAGGHALEFLLSGERKSLLFSEEILSDEGATDVLRAQLRSLLQVMLLKGAVAP